MTKMLIDSLLTTLKHNPPYIFQALANRYSLPSTLRLSRSYGAIKSIIDVGANKGDFCKIARKQYPNSFIFAYEPLSCYEKVLKSYFINDNKFKLFTSAVGEKKKMIDFHVDKHLDSSSILKATSNHRKLYPFSGIKKTHKVMVTTLDESLKDYNLGNTIVKIDVQGYDDRVLLGAKKTLKFVVLVSIEVSFNSLYKHQASFDDIYSILKSSGFVFSGMVDIIKNVKSGQIVSGDALFSRSM